MQPISLEEDFSQETFLVELPQKVEISFRIRVELGGNASDESVKASKSKPIRTFPFAHLPLFNWLIPPFFSVPLPKVLRRKVHSSTHTSSQHLLNTFTERSLQLPFPHIPSIYTSPTSLPTTPSLSPSFSETSPSSQSTGTSPTMSQNHWGYNPSFGRDEQTSMPYFPSWQVKLPHPLDRRPSQVSTDSNWPQFGESSKDFEQVDESQSPVVSTSSRDSRYFPQHPARDYDDPEDRRN